MATNQLALVIPNFNGGQYIEATLHSLVSQRPYLRWHLQDAGSSDHSVAIAKQLAGHNDSIAVEKDAGQADGLNKAFHHLGGEIIGWINSDDILAEGAAEAVVACFADNPDIDIVYGEVDWIGADGALLGHHAGRIDSLRDVLDIYGVWWNGLQWVQPEVFFRRSIYEKVGGLDISYDLAFDFDLWVRMFEGGARSRRIHRTLAKFRLHDAQKSKRAIEAANEIRSILANALARQPNLPHSFLRRLREILEYDCYQSGTGTFTKKERPSLLTAVLRHPHWLFISEVRRRIKNALLKKIS